jgi:hypothetical protein
VRCVWAGAVVETVKRTSSNAQQSVGVENDLKIDNLLMEKLRVQALACWLGLQERKLKLEL